MFTDDEIGQVASERDVDSLRADLQNGLLIGRCCSMWKNAKCCMWVITICRPMLVIMLRAP